MSCNCRACVSAARKVGYAATGPLRTPIVADPQVDGGKHADHAGGSRTFSGLIEQGGVRIRIQIEHAQFSECPDLPNGQLVLLAQ